MKILCLFSCGRLRKQKTVTGKAFVMESYCPLTGTDQSVRREGKGRAGLYSYIFIEIYIHIVCVCLFSYIYLHREVRIIISGETKMNIFS